MTAAGPAQPVTRSRLRAALAAHGVDASEQMLTDCIAACKRDSKAPEAIQILQTYGGRPQAVFWEGLAVEITDLKLWEEVVSGWVAKGYNPLNVADMLAAYKAGGLQGRKAQQLAPRSMNAALAFAAETGLDASGGHD